MKIEHIIEAIADSLGKKIFNEWHHEGAIENVEDDWLDLEIDGTRYCVMVTPIHRVAAAHGNQPPEGGYAMIGEAEEKPSCVIEPYEESAEPEPEKPKRRKIDHDKILALRNAGWTNKKIAEEMHISPNQVSHSLSRSKKLMEEGK